MDIFDSGIRLVGAFCAGWCIGAVITYILFYWMVKGDDYE